MIKLIAIDLDGTLLTEEKIIALGNKEALQKGRQRGVKIVLCTGRPLAGITPYLEELELQGSEDYSITFNGGLVQKNDTGEIVAKSALALAEVLDIASLSQKLSLPLDVLSDADVLQLPTSNEHLSIYSHLNPLLSFHSATFEDLTENRLFNKVVEGYNQDYLNQKITKIPPDYRQRYEVIKTRANLLEFMPKGITKAYGIEALIKKLDLKQAAVMGIGDEENDLPMIQYAGLGVSMANAVEIVKQHADVIT